MVILKNVYLYRSNPKPNCWLGTINAFLVVTVNVLYVLICNNCEFFYIGPTEELKQRTWKHKSLVFHLNNSNCKKCWEHLRTCSKMKEPYFNIYPFLYEENKYLREFKERRYSELGTTIKFLSINPLYTLTRI